MKTLEEIKDKVAKQYSFSNYKEFCQLTRNVDTDIVFIMDGFFNKVAKRYAKEVVIASLEKASENAKVNCNHEEIKKEFTDVDSGYLYFVDKQSIINENNIIK